MHKKNTYILIGLLVAAVIVLLIIAVVRSLSPQVLLKPTPSPIPTATPLPTLTPSTPPGTKQVVKYTPGSVEKLLQKVQKRQPLSPNDTGARQSLISSLGNKSGILQATNTYRIEYVKSPDIFMVELLTDQVEQTKREVVNWFNKQGLGSEGVCNLPIIFYLGSEPQKNLRGTSFEFNPLPTGC